MKHGIFLTDSKEYALLIDPEYPDSHNFAHQENIWQ